MFKNFFAKLIDQELIDFFKNQIESKSFRSGVSVEDSYEEIKIIGMEIKNNMGM